MRAPRVQSAGDRLGKRARCGDRVPRDPPLPASSQSSRDPRQADRSSSRSAEYLIAQGQIISTGRSTPALQAARRQRRIMAEIVGSPASTCATAPTATIEDLSIEHLAASANGQISQLFLRRPRIGSPFSKGPRPACRRGQEVIQQTARGQRRTPGHLSRALTRCGLRPTWPILCSICRERRSAVVSNFTDEQPRRCARRDAELTARSHPRIHRRHRAAEVLDHMEPDDAADLIAQLVDTRRRPAQIMEPEEEAEDVRIILQFARTRWRSHDDDPIILALRRDDRRGTGDVRNHEVHPALATLHVCVATAALRNADGQFLGTVHFQRCFGTPAAPSARSSMIQPRPVARRASAQQRSPGAWPTTISSQLPVVDTAAPSARCGSPSTTSSTHILPDDWRRTIRAIRPALTGSIRLASTMRHPATTAQSRAAAAPAPAPGDRFGRVHRDVRPRDGHPCIPHDPDDRSAACG